MPAGILDPLRLVAGDNLRAFHTPAVSKNAVMIGASFDVARG
jgi:hypothetical protein